MSSYQSADISNPLVSVLMPAYNAEKYISESIKSVINQSYVNWELVIVNDGSTDSTAEVIEKWRKKDHRILSITNITNRGLGFSTNRALQASNGKFIAKLDADDIVTGDWLRNRVQYLISSPSVIAVSGSRFLMNKRGHRIRKLNEHFLPITVRWRLIFGNPVVHPGILFRASEELQYSEYNYLEDWDLWSRLVSKGDIIVLNDHKISYRIHPENTSLKNKTKEPLLPIIKEIMARQLIEHKININPELVWYLYRDRLPFNGEKTKIMDSAFFLIQMFEGFLNSYPGLEKKELQQLKLSFWDELFHLMRLGRMDWYLIGKAYKKFPISFKEILSCSIGRSIFKKGLFLCFRNLLLS